MCAHVHAHTLTHARAHAHTHTHTHTHAHTHTHTRTHAKTHTFTEDRSAAHTSGTGQHATAPTYVLEPPRRLEAGWVFIVTYKAHSLSYSRVHSRVTAVHARIHRRACTDTQTRLCTKSRGMPPEKAKAS